MKVLHLVSGGDGGGAKTHVLTLLGALGGRADAALLCLGGGPLWEGALARGLRCRRTSGGFAAQLRAVKAELDGGGYDLLHCHGARANVLGALLRPRRGLPVISTVHSDHTLDYLARPAARLTYGTLNGLALRKMDALVCVSEAMSALYRSRGFDPVYPIYNGADFSALPAPLPRNRRAEALGIGAAETDVLALCMARLDPVKELATAVRALARTGPEVKLILAGSGPEEGRLRALAKELGVADRTFFPGWVGDPELWYAGADLAVLTSRSETFPYALTDAARHALPVISTAVGGIPALVEQGVTGLLFPVGDDEALGRALDALAADPGLRRTLGEALRRRGEERFSLEAMADRQAEIYREILG